MDISELNLNNISVHESFDQFIILFKFSETCIYSSIVFGRHFKFLMIDTYLIFPSKLLKTFVESISIFQIFISS